MRKCANCQEGISGHRTGDPEGRPLCNRPHCHLTTDFAPTLIREDGIPVAVAYHLRYAHGARCRPTYPVSPTFSPAEFAAVLASLTNYLDAPRPVAGEPLFDLETDLVGAGGR